MPVYFNRVKLDRTSFLLTKRLAWASVTRTEQGVKDNFSKILLKRILPRIGRFLRSPYGNIVSSFDRSFRPGEASILLSSRIRPHSPPCLGKFLCCAAKKRITLLQEFCHISVGTLVHIRESTCCTLKKKANTSFANIWSRNWGTHCMTTRLLTPNSHQTAKRLCSLPGPLSTTEPPLNIYTSNIIAVIEKK